MQPPNVDGTDIRGNQTVASFNPFKSPTGTASQLHASSGRCIPTPRGYSLSSRSIVTPVWHSAHCAESPEADSFSSSTATSVGVEHINRRHFGRRKARVTNTSGFEVNGTISIRSFNSRTILCTRTPFIPTHAPTGSMRSIRGINRYLRALAGFAAIAQISE